jgi:hypothetical protein
VAILTEEADVVCYLLVVEEGGLLKGFKSLYRDLVGALQHSVFGVCDSVLA